MAPHVPKYAAGPFLYYALTLTLYLKIKQRGVQPKEKKEEGMLENEADGDPVVFNGVAKEGEAEAFGC